MTSLMIVGATGLVGGAALDIALADPRISKVVAPTRRPLLPHSRLLNPIVDFANLPRNADWWAVDAMICALGTTRSAAGSAAAFRRIDFDIPVSVARLLKQHGAERMALVSSMGANSRSRFLYLRTKGELERAIAELDWTSLTVVRPGLLLGDRRERRVGEQVAGVLLGALLPLLPRNLHPSCVGKVAETLIEAIVVRRSGICVKKAAQLA